jgi:hypothetical protein
MTNEGAELVKTSADVVAGTTALAAFLGYLPEIAGLFTIVWTAIRIYEWVRQKLYDKPADPTTKE